jgi:hypothetical protein
MSFRFRLVLVLLLALPGSAIAQWQPQGNLANVPVIPDCNATAGDIAVARAPGVIYYCPTSADRINQLDPGAGHFYYVHEYGHIALNSIDEPSADCWAVQQLLHAPNGATFIRAMLSHLARRAAAGEPSYPRYGTPAERATRIRECAGGGY